MADVTMEGPRPGRGWRVLFIGDHGKVVTFRHMKALGISAGVVLIASLAAVAVLVVSNRQLHGSVRELRQQLEASRQAIQALREERDMLTAHVVLAETKLKEMVAGARRSPGNSKPGPAVEGLPDEQGSAGEPSASQKPELPPREKADQPARGSGGDIAVEGFRIWFDEGRHSFDLRYKVVNTSQKGKPLSGHVIVVLKGDELAPEQWLSMPRVDLLQGRPSGTQKGYSFAIRHSKGVTQSMRAPETFPALTQAVLYVFSDEGTLLSASDYAIDIRPSGGG